MEGWIKLHRQLLNWEWYKDVNVKTVFIHLLLIANHEEKRWQGHVIKRGEVITSYGHIGEDIGLTARQVRTAISKLKMTGEVSTKKSNRFLLVSIANYDLYQMREEKMSDNKSDNESHRSHTEVTQKSTNKNDKNDKEGEEIKKRAVVDFYQNNLGELTPFGLEQLESYYDDFDPEVIIYAMQIAVEQNKRTIGYVKGILNNWCKKGLFNLVDIKNERKPEEKQETDEELFQRRLKLLGG